MNNFSFFFIFFTYFSFLWATWDVSHDEAHLMTFPISIYVLRILYNIVHHYVMLVFCYGIQIECRHELSFSNNLFRHIFYSIWCLILFVRKGNYHPINFHFLTHNNSHLSFSMLIRQPSLIQFHFFLRLYSFHFLLFLCLRIQKFDCFLLIQCFKCHLFMVEFLSFALHSTLFSI